MSFGNLQNVAIYGNGLAAWQEVKKSTKETKLVQKCFGKEGPKSEKCLLDNQISGNADSHFKSTEK